MKELNKSYLKLTDEEKRSFLTEHYLNQKLTLQQIAEITDTYPNRIRRDLKKLNITLRTRKKASKIAKERGRLKCPTAGKELDDKTKEKISKSREKAWEKMSDKKREKFREKRREWFKDWDGKDEFVKKGFEGIRKAAQEGSKLEHELASYLEKRDYDVHLHATQIVGHTKMHLDLYIPSLQLIIEVDGPVHFRPIFGEEKLRKTEQSDNEKNKLLLAAGFRVIRVRQNKSFTKSNIKLIIKKMMAAILSNKKFQIISDDEQYEPKT